MNNDELRQLVEDPDVPDLDAATRERIVNAAVSRYVQAAPVRTATIRQSWRDWLAPALKPALAVAAGLVLVIGLRYGESPGTDRDRYDAAVFEQYELLFPDELRAVVWREGDVDVVLGDRATQSNPVVLIRLEIEGEPVYITAYSGQTIETEIGGRSVSLDILTTSGRGALVASDDFIIDSGIVHGPADFTGDAHVLETRL